MSDTKITPEWCEEQARNWSDKADGSALAGWRLPAEQERQLAEVHLLAARALKAREWLTGRARFGTSTVALRILEGREP